MGSTLYVQLSESSELVKTKSIISLNMFMYVHIYTTQSKTVLTAF